MIKIFLALWGCGPEEPGAGPALDTSVPDAPLELCVNEFVASNRSGWQGDDGRFPDWIELHNPTAEPVSLDGWYLTDDPADPYLAPLDPAASIEPGGFLVLAADGLVLPFRLAADGEAIGLFRRDGAGEVLSFGAVETDFAWARQPDCCPDPATCAEQVWLGTPGATNTPARSASW